MDTRQYCLDNVILSGSFNITHNGVKKVYEPISWTKITKDNIKSFHNNKKNSFLIVTGTKTNIVVLDCDINKAQGNFPQDLLDYLDTNCKSIVKTPNGKHYYFSCNKVIKKQTGAFWKGKKIDNFDILAEHSHIIAPPSHYTRGDTIVKYEWIRGGLDTLVEISDELLQFISIPKKNNSVVNIDTILENLSVERYTDYNFWLNIGMILKSEGYSWELWDNYSKKAKNYELGVCSSKWNTFSDKSDLTIATLYKYLKEDNSEVFYSLKNNGSKYLDALIACTHTNYAKLFYINYDENYIYDKEKKIWYVLQENNTWRIETTVNLKKPINDFFTELINMTLSNLDNSEESLSYKKNLNKALNNISTNGFLESIVSMLKEYFTPIFNPFEKFDCNPNILAFNNCLYDTELLGYRNILPTDYITITTGYDAPPLDYPIDDKLKLFFYSLFEDEEQMNYFLRILAYSLFGNRRHQELYVLQGSGGNGKSLVINLLLRILGNYCKNIPSTYLTKPSDGKDGALPTLADAKDARILYTSELEAKDTLQIGFLKLISGGDMLTVRKLHSTSFSFIPQFLLFILLNDLKLSKVDPAITRRLRVIKFPFQFREEIKQDNERLIDKSLEQYIKTSSCKLSLITWLLNIYSKDVHNKNSLTQSKKSIEDTKECLSDNNPLSSWLIDNYETNSSEKTYAGELLKHYNSENQKIRPNELNNYLLTLGFNVKKYQNKAYYNFKRKENNSEFLE